MVTRLVRLLHYCSGGGVLFRSTGESGSGSHHPFMPMVGPASLRTTLSLSLSAMRQATVGQRRCHPTPAPAPARAAVASLIATPPPRPSRHHQTVDQFSRYQLEKTKLGNMEGCGGNAIAATGCSRTTLPPPTTGPGFLGETLREPTKTLTGGGGGAGRDAAVVTSADSCLLANRIFMLRSATYVTACKFVPLQGL
ncbi:hypothetical protein J6590_069289 [Homalodisca vitripennis]|nr:hypothetical protein J6590_069289 [Homalodisca vitripennis]